MSEPKIFATTRLRDVASDIVKSASSWQRDIAERDGVSAFDAWATLAKAVLARTMRIEAPPRE